MKDDAYGSQYSLHCSFSMSRRNRRKVSTRQPILNFSLFILNFINPVRGRNRFLPTDDNEGCDEWQGIVHEWDHVFAALLWHIDCMWVWNGRKGVSGARWSADRSGWGQWEVERMSEWVNEKTVLPVFLIVHKPFSLRSFSFSNSQYFLQCAAVDSWLLSLRWRSRSVDH